MAKTTKANAATILVLVLSTLIAGALIGQAPELTLPTSSPIRRAS